MTFLNAALPVLVNGLKMEGWRDHVVFQRCSEASRGTFLGFAQPSKALEGP